MNEDSELHTDSGMEDEEEKNTKNDEEFLMLSTIIDTEQTSPDKVREKDIRVAKEAVSIKLGIIKDIKMQKSPEPKKTRFMLKESIHEEVKHKTLEEREKEA